MFYVTFKFHDNSVNTGPGSPKKPRRYRVKGGVLHKQMYENRIKFAIFGKGMGSLSYLFLHK